MARHTTARAVSSGLPLDALPCIWMSAGLVAYKLCDQAFDCEHCLFDRAMRGAAHDPAAEASRALARGARRHPRRPRL